MSENNDKKNTELTDFQILELACQITKQLDGVPVSIAMEAIDAAKKWICFSQKVSAANMNEIQRYEIKHYGSLQAPCGD